MAIKSDYTNPIAEVAKPDSGWIVSPYEATLLQADYKFYCPDFDCTDTQRALFIKTSKLGNKYFSHRPGFGHDIRSETLLHKLAIKWFKYKTEFEVPKYQNKEKLLAAQTIRLNTDETLLEYSRLKRIVPDVKLQSLDGFSFAIEIVVTSDIGLNKRKLINDFGLPTIRIELSSFYKLHQDKCRVDVDFIESNLTGLLTDLSRQSWVIPPDFESMPDEIVTTISKVSDRIGNPSDGCLNIIVLPIIGLCLLMGWYIISAKA